MFQNDLSYNVDTGLKMYADDHQIYETGKEINTVLSAVPSDEPQRDEFESLKPKKSNWTPPDGQFTSVDLFVKKCRVDIQKLNFNKSLKFSNLSKGTVIIYGRGGG